jgi:tetratricopeptide (TPR) repeat protein
MVVGMEDFLETIRSNPREDFYYLNLGRVLMSLGDELRTQGVPLGQADPRANVQSLLELRDLEQVQSFVQRQTPLGMLSYAEAVLRQARDLNPLNKDHYANLGRLNNFWYGWTQDTSRLQQAEAWYAQVAAIAPRDVTLMNEHAGVLGQLGSASLRSGDGDAAQRYFSQAQQLLDQSRSYDQRYADTDMRQADLFRLQGQLDEATERYIAVLRRNPRQLDSSIERIAAALAPEPDLIRRLRDTYNELAGNNGLSYAISGLLSVRVGDNEQAASAYERAVALQPTSAEFRRNYSLVLSSTMRYRDAAAQAREAVTLLQTQPGRQQEVQQLQALITELERKAGGG